VSFREKINQIIRVDVIKN